MPKLYLQDFIDAIRREREADFCKEHALFAAVLRVQSAPGLHRLTCPSCPPPDRDHFPLVPWVNRSRKVELRCALGCGYRQAIDSRLRTLILQGCDLTEDREDVQRRLIGAFQGGPVGLIPHESEDRS